MNKDSAIYVLSIVILVTVLIFGGVLFLPWKTINWGTISLKPSSTIVVSGTAKNEVQTQIASFNAGINVVNDNKENAISEANSKIQALIEAVKEFGVPTSDIKTQNLNVYQREEMYYDNGVQKNRPGQWSVGNTIEIKLRDVNRATDLADVLTQSGANNIYGPNFSLDDTENAENELLSKAIENAREKAMIIASSSGKKLGKIISVSEGFSSQQSVFSRMADGMGGGGAPLEPGTGTVDKVVTVTFELN